MGYWIRDKNGDLEQTTADRIYEGQQQGIYGSSTQIAKISFLQELNPFWKAQFKPLPDVPELCRDPKDMGWLDRQFAKTNLFLLICLPIVIHVIYPVVLLLSGVTIFTSDYYAARRRAKIVFGVLFTIFILEVVVTVLLLNMPSD